MPPQYLKWKLIPMRTLVAALAMTCLSACGFVGFPGVYRIDVEQGNIVTQEMADQLKPGMSRRQVRFILGTPLVEDTFNENRWDYLYVKRNGLEVLDEAHLTVIFEGDTLTEVRGDYLPPAWSSETPVSDEVEPDSVDDDEAA
jgi:outer membrane protein assembly factor BamE